MASTTTLTSNLKLRLSPNLSDDGRYNLLRLDTIGKTYFTDSSNNVSVRSVNNLFLLPEDPNIGGSGSGGEVSIGSSGQSIDTFNCYAALANFQSSPIRTSGGLQLQGSTYRTSLLAASSGQASNLTFRLPAADGTNGQVLRTDGSGNLSWTSVSGALNSASYTWIPGDGDIKTIVHNWGTRKVVATVLDTGDDYREVIVDISRPTDNQIILDASAIPPNNWIVLLQEVP